MLSVYCIGKAGLLEVAHTKDINDKIYLTANLSNHSTQLTPQQARQLARSLVKAADTFDPPKKEPGSPLFATIRKESKYSCQQELSGDGLPIPFSVTIDMERLFDGYIVKGGPGGCYRLYDVHLWRKVEGTFATVPVHDTPYILSFSGMYG